MDEAGSRVEGKGSWRKNMGSKVFKEKEKLTFIDLQPPQIIELRKKRLSLEKKNKKKT